MVNVGINLGFAALDDQLTDEQMYHGELDLAVLADRLGYDTVWIVEHHFSDYSLCPDNLLMLSHLAGRTSRIKLGTAAVIVPWNDPLRVAEKALMVDNISGGRLLLGLGRGLSRTEYEPFRVTLDETRDRFDEAAPMIFEAVETGVIEGAGPLYPQPRAELRPRPRESFIGRRFCVAGSPESVVMAAKLRAALMSFIVRPVPDLMPTFTKYRELYEAEWGETAPPISLAVNMYCHEDVEVARERQFEYVNRFFMSNIEHYEMARRQLRSHDTVGRPGTNPRPDRGNPRRPRRLRTEPVDLVRRHAVRAVPGQHRTVRPRGHAEGQQPERQASQRGRHDLTGGAHGLRRLGRRHHRCRQWRRAWAGTGVRSRGLPPLPAWLRTVLSGAECGDHRDGEDRHRDGQGQAHGG